MKRLIICLSCALLATATTAGAREWGRAPAQYLVTVSGTVTDQDGALVADATVRALSLTSGRILTTSTNSAGVYELCELSLGSYRFSVSRQGFGAQDRIISLDSFQPAREDFTLAPAGVEDSMTVTASKGGARQSFETPQTVTVVDESDIEKRRSKSALASLEKTPNMIPVGASPFNERPRLRGLASNRLLLLLDGERLNNARSDPLSGVSPSVVDVMQLQSAEIIGGAFSSQYGSDALAGVVNLLTKAPERVSEGHRLALRFDGSAHSNSALRSGAATVNWSVPRVALRLGGTLFRAGNYSSGDAPIPLAEVVRLGGFATELGNAAGNNVARTYAVWELPARSKIANGQAHGFYTQADAWFIPAPKHALRYRQLNSQHKNIGFPFVAPPYDARRQFNSFRRLDKYGVRYEGFELEKWLARVAANFYLQKYSFSDDNLVSTINAGSSWRIGTLPGSPHVAVSQLTGAPSIFAPGNLTHGKNTVTAYGADAQATFALSPRALLTSGVALLRDASRDEFARLDFVSGASAKSVGGRASNPDATYTNLGWYGLLEFDVREWLRLNGGWRLDRWETEARPTEGFPLGTETAALDASLQLLAARSGPINFKGVEGIAALIKDGLNLSTQNGVLTGNVGLIVRLPGRVNSFVRWGSSYREPGITERYILRNFGDPTFSVLLVPNTAARPERGRNLDLGVKAQRQNWSASFNYFRNNLTDFLRPVFSAPFFVPADVPRGLQPISPFFPFHGVLYVQRANTARARIQGFEFVSHSTLRLGRVGALAASGAFGWLRGSDLTPDENAVKLIERYYNRSDTPIALEGSVKDAPLSGITPFRGVFGLRFNSREGRWFAEYELRAQSRVKRADPLEISATISTQYGTLASLNPFAKQTLRSGYQLRREDIRLLLTFGVENLTNRLYFEHFQNAPAPGRSFVFGVTFESFDLLRL